MSSTNAHKCCGRLPDPKEVLCSDADLDEAEDAILAVARFFFQSFAMPRSQAWMTGLDLAEATFGDRDGPVTATRLLTAMRAMRYSRRSTFCFNSPTCETCAATLTEHERRFIAALKAIRMGRIGHAQTELLMLCEGNDITQVVGAMTRLSISLPVSRLFETRTIHVQDAL